MNRKEISQVLRTQYKRKIVTATQLDIIEFLLKNPGNSPTNFMRKTKTIVPRSTVMRNFTTLRVLGIIDSKNTIHLKEIEVERRHFLLPDVITKGELPPVEYRHVHLAAKLADMDDNEVLQGLTKTERLAEWKAECDKNLEHLYKIVYELQRNLAQLAMYGGDLTAFKDMTGINFYEGETE